MRIYLNIPQGVISTAGTFSKTEGSIIEFNKSYNTIHIIQSKLIISFNRKVMTQSVYRPKSCAFHPKETIFNFCRNPSCLLPLCPTCVDLHTEEHKQEKSYGKFQNIHQVVNDITYNLESNLKQLDNITEEIKEQLSEKELDEQHIKRQISEAKEKVLGLVQRFFHDFEKQINKNIVQFKVSMTENYRQMQTQIKSMKQEINSKIQSLPTQKVLKTVIAYHSKQQNKKITSSINTLRETLDLCGSKRATLLVDNNSIHKMVNQLSQYMYLSFENWEQDIKYVADFIKTGFTSKSNSPNATITGQ